jgi:carbon-monoxide dehydrogenase small subunit
MHALELIVNGQAHRLQVAPQRLLVDLLRDDLALTGTHKGCDTAQCGACTVRVNGQAVKSCNLLALQAAGASVQTIEGLAAKGRALHAVQEAFIACHGLQCGYCTPGMIMSAVALLAETPAPSEAQIVDALDCNLCRCTGYVNIIAAVRQAAQAMRGGAR